MRRVLVLDEYTCSVLHEIRRWMVDERETLMGVAKRLDERGELTGHDLWRQRKKMPIMNHRWAADMAEPVVWVVVAQAGALLGMVARMWWRGRDRRRA